MKLFHGNHIRLRAIEPADIDVMYQWENDSTLWKFGASHTLISKNALQTMVNQAHLSIYETEQQRFMIEDHNGNRVGVADLFHFDFFHSRIELGLLFSANYQGNGYGKEAVELLEQYLFDFLSIHQIVVEIAEDNEPCISLFQKSHYHLAGIMKEWIKRGDRYFDVHIYQKLNVR